MPDTSPSYEGPLNTLLDMADNHLGLLNVALAYVPDLDNRDDHLLVVQDLMDEIDALRGDL